jgi:hypothetical protein
MPRWCAVAAAVLLLLLPATWGLDASSTSCNSTWIVRSAEELLGQRFSAAAQATSPDGVMPPEFQSSLDSLLASMANAVRVRTRMRSCMPRMHLTH